MINEILKWLSDGERGMSSEVIAFRMMGSTDYVGSTPYDPSDFKRCLKLVNRVPEIRKHLDLLRPISPRWNALVEHWDELEACFMREVPEWLNNTHGEKLAHETYCLMQKIYEQGD